MISLSENWFGLIDSNNTPPLSNEAVWQGINGCVWQLDFQSQHIAPHTDDRPRECRTHYASYLCLTMSIFQDRTSIRINVLLQIAT